jgi:hypothetical protein
VNQIYRVVSTKPVHNSDPLHVDNFYPDKQRLHHRARNKRQDLILYLANLHSAAIRTGMPLGMIHIPMRLMSLRDWCQDYHDVLYKFFDVRQRGYNLGDGNHEISTLVPKRLTLGPARLASQHASGLVFSPGLAPNSKVISKVYVRQGRSEQILKRLADCQRLDLHSPVEWLLEQSTINFHFEPAGRLQQRDTSVWPVRGIETWPSWLREELFGPGIDIDSAYTQFLVAHLRDMMADRPALLTMLYPDLLRSLTDKKQWRIELCRDVLGMEVNDENIGKVKRLCMSLANGSRISPAILIGSRAFSITADIVISCTDDVSPINLIRIGKRLEGIGKQYVMARKAICAHHLRRNPTRANQKLVFSSYFKWERAARYLIWEEVGRHGVMVHDGIDGIPPEHLARLPEIMEQLNLRLTV